MNRTLFTTVICIQALAASCGGNGKTDDRSTGQHSLQGAHHGYVVSQLLLPATAAEQLEYGLDLGSQASSEPDGHIDNLLGAAFVTLATQGMRIQPAVDVAVDRGSILMLADLQTTDLANAAEAGFRVLQGANPLPPACSSDDDTTCRRHLDGNGRFTTNPSFPDNTAVTGAIVDGIFSAGPGSISLPIAIADIPLVTLNLTNARVRATAISEAGLTMVIGGAVTITEMRNNLVPTIFPHVETIIERDCPVPPGTARVPPGCSCNETGALLIQFFDKAPQDCEISLQELQDEAAIREAVKPDVCAEDVCPADIPDAASIGFKVHTVKAQFQLGTDDPTLPPDPTTIAPALDRTVPTSIAVATSFLYTGEGAIQSGVEPGTIESKRVAVLRGHVAGQDGSPVTGATVTVLDHPEFGQTLTRSDGAYDLVTNGGGSLVIVIRKDGHLEAQRTLDVPWQDYVAVPEIVLVQVDPVAAEINLGAPDIQVARGSVVNDSSGSRRATLLFRPGTQATVQTDSGSQLLPTLTVHLTEVTTGPNGPAAMPGSLPPTSGYTYAVEVTVDEADGRTVELSQPALLYVENFLGFAVGTGMPVGIYDRRKGEWSGVPNGIVVAILQVTNGLADIDANGDGVADQPEALAALGMTEQERQQLATLYSPGQILWRSSVPHFSPIDCNRPVTLPSDARQPSLRDPRTPGGGGVDDGCDETGSVIGCHNQSLGENVPVHGTPYFLRYDSERQAGRLTDYSVDIALTDDNVPGSATSVVLDVAIAGRTFRQTFPATPNQRTMFTWDGKDAYGRLAQGRAPASISVGYVYSASYADPPITGNQFAQFGSSLVREASPIPAREQITLFQRWKTSLGPFDALPLGLGGFTLDRHHTYDPVGRVLYTGNGNTRRADTLGNTILSRVAFFSAASTGRLEHFPIRLRPNGGYYVLETGGGGGNMVVRDETDQIVAGVPGGTCSLSGDGGPARQARICLAKGVGAGPDGSLYIAGSGRIRRVTPDGIIRLIAGGPDSGPLFQCVPAGAGGPALAARLCDPQELTIARDGAVYFRDRTRDAVAQIFKIGVDGQLAVIAGAATVGFSGDGGPASQATLSSDVRLALDPAGNLVVADIGNSRIRRISTEGVITTIAGTGSRGDAGDGGPAMSATFQRLASVAVAPDGVIYVADSGSRRFRAITTNGIITAFAGGGETLFDGFPPSDASFLINTFVAVGSDGIVYLGDNRPPLTILHRVVPALPAFSGFENVIPSTNGNEIYVFDISGRHVRTVDAMTNSVKISFSYDTGGRLSSITGADGQVTQVDRDAAGRVTAIISPFGHRTNVALDHDGRLTRLDDPGGGEYAFTYDTSGLLSTYTDPRDGVHEFTPALHNFYAA